MLKRVPAFWLLVAAVAAGLAAYWAGRATSPRGKGAAEPKEAQPQTLPASPQSPIGNRQSPTHKPTTTVPPTSDYPTEADTLPRGFDAPTEDTAAERGAQPSPYPLPGGERGFEREPSGDTAATVERPSELATAFSLFDGFETGNAWAVESAADHATLAIADEQVSEGTKSLKVNWKAFGKGNFELRREVKLDLAEATAFRADVYNEGGPLDLVLGIRAGHDAALFTTPPRPLEKGWNKDVTFALADLSFAEKGPWGTSWAWSRDNVNRVSLIFRERDEKEGTVHVDNLRFDRPADKIGAKAKPVIRAIKASAQAVERYESIELAVAFDGAYQNFFDRTQVDLWASFFAPSGKKLEAKGFVYDADEAAARPAWRIRFTPTEVGIWRYDVTVKDAGGEATSQTYEFLCRQETPGTRRGFIRVSKSDPQYFEFDNGAFFYPIGQNVCWASNYDYYLDQIKGYGGNYVRIWLCPWNLQLEDPREAGKYDLGVAKALDGLLEACRAREIYVQLVLRYHGMHDASWDKNPYNAANGGPCQWASDFFTDGKAKELHKRFLDYVAARWGHSPTLFAWELWNEADLARCDRESDLVAWHREMAAHLKKADPHGHLVTTSVCSPGKANGLFELAEIDFVPIHLYTRDLAQQFRSAWLQYRRLRKPMFIGEFSAGFRPADDLDDTQGVHLHAGLWLAFTMPFAGNAMPWWWDTFIDKNKLYGHWANLVRFAAGHDRRGKGYELLTSNVQAGSQTTNLPQVANLRELAQVSLQGLVSPSEAFLFIYDEARILRPEHADRPLLFAERPLRLRGLLGGKFDVQIWDAFDGKVLSESVATTDDGTLGLVLPKSSRPIALRITKQMPAKALPRLEW